MCAGCESDPNRSSSRGILSGGQATGEQPEWFMDIFFLWSVEVCGDGDMAMNSSLRENLIKTCSVRRVMYSQRHVC
jgi:hypothetical protein